jgi:hypothetical protein
MGPFGRAMAVVGLLASMGAGSLGAQGVTTSALYGVVRGPDSSAIGDAVVTVTNTADGERWRTTTRADGRYAFEYLSVGGPYAIEARAIGFRPAGETGITLSLGERRRADVELEPVVTQLPELTARAPDARLNGSRTGPGQTFTGAQAAALPLDRRDFSQLVLLSPQAVVSRDTGISIAGQPDRLNGLRIDGASAVDLGGIHGISGFGTPGASDRVRVLPIEAIKELQVLTAPFDVRYSGFAGGLVNVVTRSGSNRWEGSVSSYFQNQSLTGKDSAGNRAQEFSTKELTATVGGPIVRDRAAFFVDVGLQRFVGERGPSIGTDTTGGADSLGFGVRRADLVRFRDILRDTYQVDPGVFGSGAPHNPAGNHAARPSGLVHGDHLDGIQIVGREAELAAEEAEAAPDHVPAHADLRILAERQDRSPGLEQRPERLAHGGAGLDGHSGPFRVVVDALHGRDIDNHPHLGVGDEPLEAMSATRHGETPSFAHRLLDRRYHLIGRADQPHVVRGRDEPLVEALFDHRAIPRVVRADSHGFEVSSGRLMVCHGAPT